MCVNNNSPSYPSIFYHRKLVRNLRIIPRIWPTAGRQGVTCDWGGMYRRLPAVPRHHTAVNDLRGFQPADPATGHHLQSETNAPLYIIITYITSIIIYLYRPRV